VSWRPGERGSTSVEAVVVLPCAMIVLLFAVQACLWAHAATMAEYAASRGEQLATLDGSSTQAGIDEAAGVLANSASAVVSDPTVQAQRLPGDRMEIRVNGYAESLLPGVRLPVSAVRFGVVQRFRVGG